ncbi:hypothetical protein ACIQF6_19840 [Kitasatospora sp. NPDC092948]|uniref:hypothetical protein n=1 Tax=Kitasatospora sp. NPDC092948 TaxID=3364088 RepID=UPI003800059B
MTTAPEQQQIVRPDDQVFPCKYYGPRDYAQAHVDAEGDIGLLVHSGETTTSIYLSPEVAEDLGITLTRAATTSRTIAQEIERVRRSEAEAALRLGELDAAHRAEQARQNGQPYLVAGGSTSPTALPQPSLADLLTAPQQTVPDTPSETTPAQDDTTADRERAFLRASELLGSDAGVASKIAMANYLLKGAA